VRRDPGRGGPGRGGRGPVRGRRSGRLGDPRGRGARAARRAGGGLTVISKLAPSPRPHGAQRMFSATTLVLEVCVVFFTLLAAHQLVPDQRALSWIWGGLTILALLVVAGMLRRWEWSYLIGMVLQILYVYMCILLCTI